MPTELNLERNDIHLWLGAQDRRGSEAFLRAVLARYLPLKAADIRLARTANGKPYLQDRRFKHLCFNLSHSDGRQVCAVSLGRCLGVDFENTQREVDVDAISRRFFALNEQQALQSMPSVTQRQEGFFRLWTCKEAYIKALGQTIASVPLASIGFAEEGAWVIPLFALPAQQRWFFRVITLPGSMIAVAQAQRSWQARRPRISLFLQ